jgi:beta-glucosidase
LSYTKFEYRNLRVEKSETSLRISLEVINTGNYPGKEVVQVYIKAPQGRIPKPFQELKGFKKTKLLNPGESERIEIEIPLRELASFDTDKKAWIIEPGVYQIRIGSSSRDIRLTTTFTIDKELVFSP